MGRGWFGSVLLALAAAAPAAAHEQPPRASPALAACAFADIVQHSRGLREQGAHQAAQAWLEASAARCPDAPPAFFVIEQAQVDRQRGHHHIGLARLQSHWDANQRDPRLQQALADALLRAGQAPRALEVLGPEATPERLPRVLLRVRLLAATGQTEAALHTLRTTRRRLGPVPALLEAQRALLVQQGQYAEAVRAWPAAPPMTLASARLDVRNAGLWLRAGEHQKAGAALRRAQHTLEQTEQRPPAWVRLNADRRELSRALGSR